MVAITVVSDLKKSTKFASFTLTIWKPSIAKKIFKLKLLKKICLVNSQCGRTVSKRHRNLCECTSVLAPINGTYAGQYANGMAEVLFNDILRRVALGTRMLLPWPLMSCAELTCLTGDFHRSDIPQLRLPPTCNKKIKLHIAPNSWQIRYLKFGLGDTQWGTSTLEGAMSISFSTPELFSFAHDSHVIKDKSSGVENVSIFSTGPCTYGKFFERLLHWKTWAYWSMFFNTISSAYLASSQAW